MARVVNDHQTSINKLLNSENNPCISRTYYPFGMKLEETQPAGDLGVTGRRGGYIDTRLRPDYRSTTAIGASSASR